MNAAPVTAGADLTVRSPFWSLATWGEEPAGWGAARSRQRPGGVQGQRPCWGSRKKFSPTGAAGERGKFRSGGEARPPDRQGTGKDLRRRYLPVRVSASEGSCRRQDGGPHEGGRRLTAVGPQAREGKERQGGHRPTQFRRSRQGAAGDPGGGCLKLARALDRRQTGR
jgi:hypothetical protein